MKMLKQATEQHNLDNSTVVIYGNVHFPQGFVCFLEALELHHVVPSSHLGESLSVENGFLWCDNRKEGGIRLETSTHPYVHDNVTERMIVEGVEESQQIVLRVLVQHGVTFTPVFP